MIEHQKQEVAFHREFLRETVSLNIAMLFDVYKFNAYSIQV